MAFLAGDDVLLDREFFLHDITASKAHVEGLANIAVVSADEAAALKHELDALAADFRSGSFVLDNRHEDGHSAIEARLTERLGDAGRRVHTGRSRNDQILVATRLWLKEQLATLQEHCRAIAKQCRVRARISSTSDAGYGVNRNRAQLSPRRSLFADASLFDGHDAAINIMRRIIQSQGAEVIHLGHNRSVEDVVRAALQEDADAIALSSYQGGHVEYFKYMVDMLRERGAGHIRVFGGGGGTITPEEIEQLLSLPSGYQRDLPSQGLDSIERAQNEVSAVPKVDIDDEISIGHMLSAIEEGKLADADLALLRGRERRVVDELLLRFLHAFPQMRAPYLKVDSNLPRSGGALLGDRIRMNSLRSHRVYMRSMATRRQHAATSIVLHDCIDFLKSQPYDLVIVETAGIGQSDSEIVDLVDFPVYVMTSEYGAASQLEKIDMIDYAELIVLNKFDKRGAEDALRDVRKQWKRNRTAFSITDDEVPVYPTIASQFNDPGVTWMFANLCRLMQDRLKLPQDKWTPQLDTTLKSPRATVLIPGQRVRYLAEIAEQGRSINAGIQKQSEFASKAQHCYESLKELGDTQLPNTLDLYQSTDLLPHIGNDDQAVDRSLLTLRQRYNAALGELSKEAIEQLRGGRRCTNPPSNAHARAGDPVGRVTLSETRPNGLLIERVRVPLGVIAMIYEARPNVTADAAALCLFAGNGVILRGGSEALQSNLAIAAALHDALRSSGLPAAALTLVDDLSREAMVELVQLVDIVDLAIPRGGEGLIRFIAEHARVPVIKHYKGVCHLYVDRAADTALALDLLIDGKTTRPGVCNALETLLVHADIAAEFLPSAAAALRGRGVELRGCERTLALVPDITTASEADYAAEFLDLIIAIRVVDGLDEAIAHIQRYGSDHTEVIATSDETAARRFVHALRAAVVMVNASSRFSDGGQLGLGAEIGISTTRLHAAARAGGQASCIKARLPDAACALEIGSIGIPAAGHRLVIGRAGARRVVSEVGQPYRDARYRLPAI
ncbi:MAG: hypothetical protein WDW38_006592 [Sanguina aurantia]